jgi:hypothetical protein
MLDFGNQPQKICITIIYEDKDTQVSWYTDTSLEDTRFAILCACDSLVDNEFEILDEKAKVVDLKAIKSFQNRSVYFLRKKNEGTVTNILLDSKRKLYVQIEPLRHIESQFAIKYMLVYNYIT